MYNPLRGNERKSFGRHEIVQPLLLGAGTCAAYWTPKDAQRCILL